MTADQLQQGDALLILDVQRDFFPGGSVPVPGSEEIVPVLNEWIVAAARSNIPIIAARDWHTAYHVSFETEGGTWPAHCVQDTPGAFFHPALRLPKDAIVVSKGTAFDADNYSAFDGTGLESFLKSSNVRRLWIGGLTEDVSIRRTVEVACRKGFETHLLLDATRPLVPNAEPAVLDAMREAGAILESRN